MDKKSDKEITIDNTAPMFIENKGIAKKEKTTKRLNVIFAIIVTFIVCLAISCGFYEFYFKDFIASTTKIEKNVTIDDTGIAEAVEKVYDSVVVVENYVNGKLYATGTGFVYKADDKYGYILTNNHVIASATEIKLVFTNGERVDSSVVGSDEYSDIAVLSVDKSDIIAVAEIGDSFSLRVGDTAFAVGAPIDASTYSWTVTRGIISGKDRLVEVRSSTSNYVMKVLQTDAAINSGNSGGPLCNANGEVVGITNMKLASSSIEGMGFAIPIEEATLYADKFISGGEIVRPYIGVSVFDVSLMNLKVSSGVYVAAVEENSPAYISGIVKGDVITKINDVDISDPSYFKYELYKFSVGDKVILTIIRDNVEKKVEVTLKSNLNA